MPYGQQEGSVNFTMSEGPMQDTTSGESPSSDSGAHAAVSFSYILCIFLRIARALDQQLVNGDFATADLCCNMHLVYENT